MNRDDAFAIVNEFVSNQNLVKHMLAVEASMQDCAERYGEDSQEWGIPGLLHDFDWEIHPSLDSHPQEGAPLLRERGVPENIIRCVLSHAEHTGVPRVSMMEKALFACDEITGLVTAVALVRPSKSIHDVRVKSVRKKWKDKRFAANVIREDIAQGAEELGVDLWEHVGHIIASMQRIAPDLGLSGIASNP
jgi:putative nucleotidyltransferase with HDIG domain